MIGASLSFCVKDLIEREGQEVEVLIGFKRHPEFPGMIIPIKEKRVLRKEDVEKIVCAFQIPRTSEDWQRKTLITYCNLYWRDCRRRALDIWENFWEAGKLSSSPYKRGHALWCNWVDRESLIRPSMDNPLSEEEIEEWISL